MCYYLKLKYIVATASYAFEFLTLFPVVIYCAFSAILLRLQKNNCNLFYTLG